MPDNSQIPFHAFVQEILNWQSTLTRESKKLKQLRRISTNKFQLNSVQIALIGIESELIQYKKIKEKKYLDSQYIVEDYTVFSKRFMNIMQKIAEAADQDRYKNTPSIDADSSNLQGRQATAKGKHFLEETFTHKVSKQPSKKKNKSCIQTRKQLSYLLKSKKKVRESVKGLQSKMIGFKQNNRNSLNFNRLSLQQQEDLSDVRYQLKQIKSMMLQIQNEIKFHTHDDIEKQVSKLAYNNKKIAAQIKNIKDDNQFILARLNNIKDQISLERKAQAEMIRLFQAGKQNKGTISQLAKSKNMAEEISEWVKVRI